MYNLDSLQFYSDSTLEDIILRNIIEFMKWGLLEVGAFYNIEKDQLNHLGENESVLRRVNYPGQTPNTIFKGAKNDWVYETGINLKYSGGSQPIRPTGVFINDVPVTSGFKINYALGAVIFNTTTTGTVKVPHTLRAVSILTKDSYEYRKITYDWPNRYNASGHEDDIEIRAFLPAIFIGLDNYRSKPLELGSRSKITTAQLSFDIYTSNPQEIKKLSDTCYMLESKTVRFFDLPTTPKALNSDGTLSTGYIPWPSSVSLNYGGKGRFKENASINKIPTSLPIFHTRATIGLEIDVSPI